MTRSAYTFCPTTLDGWMGLTITRGRHKILCPADSQLDRVSVHASQTVSLFKL